MAKKKNEAFGQKINLQEAQDMITEYFDLKGRLETKVRAGAVPPRDVERSAKIDVFKAQNFNAFVFTKELIMRFFDGSEVDAEGNPQASNYLVVILGAHKEAKTVNGKDFKAGSFTVLTAGCTKKTEQEDGKDVTRFYPLSTPEPANEYPPGTTITLTPKSTSSFKNKAGFEFLQVI
jgi:hypothetical protein